MSGAHLKKCRIVIQLGLRAMRPDVLKHWDRKINQVIAGEAPGDLHGLPLNVGDTIIEGGTRETTSA
jgi:hypothetical protein